ncbi:PHM7 [[Candida] subhashii]|uniref:PHM7 n=1 Tax=[Candida] subhashii TaxID=561895 RepID=A0A8J5QJI0_9ASCO|nr:PHM7 [[Candida] subhashii]KAG7663159.1 PHM7 [[Candida] subhashii]
MADGDSPTTTNASVSQFLSTLIPTLITAVVFVTIFLAIRKKQTRVYEPKSVVKSLPKDLQTEPVSSGAFSWLTNLLRKPQSYIIQHSGTDGYFFLRFLFEFLCVCLIGVIVTWPILFPVYATNGNNLIPGSKIKGFDILSFSNITNKWRALASVFLSWILFGLVIFLIYRELVYYVTYRHALQTTPLYDSMLSSRTLLLTEVNVDILNDSKLKELFPRANHIWYSRNYKELQDKVEDRTKLSNKYEGALNKVIIKAVKLRNKLLKKNKPVPEPENDINQYMKKRPTHRLKFLIGEKVDTLDYCPKKLKELNDDIDGMQAKFDENEQLPAVFIEFPTQLDLQRAYQALPYNSEFKLSKYFTGIAPDDIIWKNLQLSTSKRWAKKLIATSILTATIIFWCIPVAVVGSISNINFLIDKVPFLKFIDNMPQALMGIITGLLPVVLLSILMSLVPPFIKFMGKFSGCITVQQVNEYCQSWYFAFQVVNVFLAVALGSSAASVVTEILHDASKALQTLSAKFPTSVNFYFAYLCLQGLTISSGVLLQLVTLILSHILGRILDGTPRKKWTRSNTVGEPDFSTLYPGFQLLTVIALAYSVLAPLILGFTSIAFLLFYFTFIYTLIYVLRPNVHDNRGKNYVISLFQLFTGIFMAQLWITAIFVFSKNWVSVALEAVIIVISVLAKFWISRKFMPLIDTVPISAIRYASGDSNYSYPKDQGSAEIKQVGESYWQTPDGELPEAEEEHKDQVIPNKNLSENPFGYETTTLSTHPRKDEEDSSDANNPNHNHNHNEKLQVVGETPKKTLNWFKIFFQPHLQTFEQLRSILPDSYFNYIEYNEEFLAQAYDDPNVYDKMGKIWIVKDSLGLGQVEKEKAATHDVEVIDDDAGLDDKAGIEVNGPPPDKEEDIRI